MLKLGIDDAGRGPVIGPMILAGCLMNTEAEEKLKKLGVKDSKQLTPKKREELAIKIKEIAETFEIIIVCPNEIDNQNYNGIKLNEVEAFACARIINKINKGFKQIQITIDCPSVNISAWENFLKSKIKNLSNTKISCEHKADQNHTAVASASILAKQIRETEMKKLKENYGNTGSGYCSDPVTKKFLQKYAHKYKNKGIFRKTWITWKNAIKNQEQTKL